MAASNAKISNSMEGPAANLVITRVFDAPRELVWKAWTDPKLVAQWWGPKGFTNPRCEWNARPKGSIHIDMRAPDGVVYPMSGIFQEALEPQRLVFMSSALDENGKSMFDVLSTATFTDQRGKTALTLTLRVISATERAPQYLKGMEMGWKQSLDRLGEHLARSGAENGIAVLAGDREIVCTRVFDAPRDLVWLMFTDPNHIPHWWGPRGFTTTVQQMDVKPGGEWRLIMRGPDGRDYHSRIIYREVKKPERLVYEHSPEKGSEPVSFTTTVTFNEQGGQTRIEFRMTFPTGAVRDQVAQTYGAVEGLTQTLGRLAEHIEKKSSDAADAEFAITRVFNAPRELVFKAFTEPERLAQWWGPKGCAIEVRKLDLRPGGVLHYSMRMGNHPPIWGKFVYREIAPPERVVFVNSFSDENCGLTQNPWMPEWPLEVLNTLTLTEHEGRTTLSLRGGPINASEEQRKAFEANCKGMEQGFAGTFDQLDAYLANA
jgi:uncharacterized protein YndB with AHSA1/START domain